MNTPQDSGYKLLFSHPQMVRELLRDWVPGEWVAQLDFATLERVNASYVADSHKQRHDDMVWRVRLADRWLWVYLVLEFQYEARLKLHPAETVRGIVEALFRLEHGRAPQDFPRVVQALHGLLREPALSGLRRSFNLWIKRLLRRRVAAPTLGDIERIEDLLDPNAMIEERIEAWFEEATRKGLERGREEGRMKGRMEGEARLLARQLERRCGPLPPPVRERLTGASEAQLETWSDALLSAPSLDAVFEA